MADPAALPYTYDGRSIYRHVLAEAPLPLAPPEETRHDDVFVYVMGPYTPFDLSYVVDVEFEEYVDDPATIGEAATAGREDLLAAVYEELAADPYVDGDLFDPAAHEDMEETLRAVRDELRSDPGVRAFLATDVGIPTEREADEGEPALSPVDQSVEFAMVADLVVFVLDQSGLNNGVATEVGSVLGELDLRTRGRDPPKKPGGRLRIYRSENVPSATLDEIDEAYDVDKYEYDDRADLVRNLRERVRTVVRRSRGEGESFPLFYPDAVPDYPAPRR